MDHFITLCKILLLQIVWYKLKLCHITTMVAPSRCSVCLVLRSHGTKSTLCCITDMVVVPLWPLYEIMQNTYTVLCNTDDG